MSSSILTPPGLQPCPTASSGCTSAGCNPAHTPRSPAAPTVRLTQGHHPC